MAPSSLKETSVLSASKDREGFTFASVFLSFHSYWPWVQRAGTEIHLLGSGHVVTVEDPFHGLVFVL